MNKELQKIESIKSLPTRDLIKASGGWIKGHITFENGEHGNGYVDNLRFLCHPQIMTEIGSRLAGQFTDHKDNIDVIVGPSIIGAVIAYSVANQLQIPFTTTYRQYGTGEMTFHRGFVPPEGSQCLFVDDFIFSGNCVQNNVNYMQKLGLTVVGVSVIGARKIPDLEVPVKSLITIDFIKTHQEQCSLCNNNIPIIAFNIRE